MPLEFQCGCGKRLRAKDELAGRRVKCPQCAKPLTVPAVRKPALVTPSARPASASASRPETTGGDKLAGLLTHLGERGAEALPVLLNGLSPAGAERLGRLVALMTDEERRQLAKMLDAAGPERAGPLGQVLTAKPPEAFLAQTRAPTQAPRAQPDGCGAVITVLVIIKLILLAIFGILSWAGVKF